MQLRKALLQSVGLLALFSGSALATCPGGSSPPGVPFNCTPAVSGPVYNDLVFGGATSGPQNGQSLRWTWGQVFTGTTLTSPLIINGTIQSLNAPLPGLYGGTGVANSGKTITLGGNVTTAGAFTLSGAFPLTFTLTGSTSITLPTSGTLLGNSLTNTHIYVGNASNVATDVAMSGDVAITNAGATTVSKIGGNTLALAGATSLGTASSTVGAGTYYAGHSLINVQIFTSTATYIPTAGTNQVIIKVQAPGGGGGGCPATDATHACVGGSGAAGSYAEGLFTSGFSGITMTLGAVGAAGSNTPGAGGTGGTTSAGTLISCPGGTGGPAGTSFTAPTTLFPVTGSAAAPAACTTSGGTIISSIAGQRSSTGFAGAITTNQQFAGQSGSSPLGIGVPALFNAAVATSTGTAGTGYGWGAGGSYSDASQAATTGLAGGPPRIIVEEYN